VLDLLSFVAARATMLTVEMIPKTSFFKNLRSELKGSEWDTIRRAVYKRSNYFCEIEGCGGRGSKHPVECHEIWDYTGTKQILKGLIALCPKCHMVKHWGLTQLRGQEHIAFAHLKKVNCWNDQQANAHIMEAIALWHARNEVIWKLDISWITSFLKNS